MRTCRVLKLLCVGVVAAMAGVTCAAGQAVSGAGSLVDENNGPRAGFQTHVRIVLPSRRESRGPEVLHLPPRGLLDKDGKLVGAKPGEARIATALFSPPVAVAARDGRLAMVFVDAFPAASGRTLLTMGAALKSPGVWETTPQGRLDSLPSLRADGLLLGFAGAEAGYCALYQGLTADKADPSKDKVDSSKLVMQMLVGSAWVDVLLPAEVQAIAGECFSFNAEKKPVTTAVWRLFATPDGVGLLVLPPKAAGGGGDGVVGTLMTAKIPTPGPKESPTPDVVGARSEPWSAAASRPQVSVLSAAGHIVITALSTKASASEGVLHVFTRPLAQPELAWREVATVPSISTDHVVMALDGVGRIAIESSPVSGASLKDQPKQMLTEVSVGTGAVMYSGELLVTSPISGADYRMVGVILAYALGMVVIFLVKTPRPDAVLIPEGYSIAEPGRRIVAGIIDVAIGVALASKIWHVPLADAISPGSLGTEAGQGVILTSVGLMIALGTVLELLFAAWIGKIVTGCEVVAVGEVGGKPPAEKTAGEAGASGEPKEDEGPAHGTFAHLLLRNAIKFGLPPVALLGLFDASGRHRGDQLAQTAVVVEGVEEEGQDGGMDEE